MECEDYRTIILVILLFFIGMRGITWKEEVKRLREELEATQARCQELTQQVEALSNGL